MAKEITIKTQEGVSHIFALKEIVLKGEIITQYPSGARWSDGLTKPYVYGESYIAQIPDEMLAQIAALLMPAPVVEEPTEGGGDAQESGAK